MNSNNRWYVYVLGGLDHDKWYIGHTKDLKKRILSHNNGNNFWTRRYKPWKIIYAEFSLNRNDARARERYLKSGMGRRYLKNRLKFFFS